ncbi:hypothetical protein LA635_p1002 (plasmid) [Erwinia amylovora LA635]|uniref:Uncharacterized protein n=1 Tax=Erwinia amylovora TaxID=552 RepID=A0A0P0ZGJ1_ERWAM|nr:hypothetical protein LA635_p1002 [Erwinia amylovora LA635]CDK23780.1 hypothetical protein LA636_p1002 [Erwinia amylovora LA636]CDK23829.1 hypothetical protein LA637_p1002 [Erwinia amylovora LA637]CDM08128.1 hypothetical protein EAMY692_p20002 [Erwinia amylovora]
MLRNYASVAHHSDSQAPCLHKPVFRRNPAERRKYRDMSPLRPSVSRPDDSHRFEYLPDAVVRYWFPVESGTNFPSPQAGNRHRCWSVRRAVPVPAMWG